MPYSREQKIGALKREISFRRRVYPKQMTKGYMSADKATFEIEVMQAILLDYEEEGDFENDSRTTNE